MHEPKSRRAFERAPIVLEVDLHSEHNFYSGLTGDIGEGGLFVGTHVLPEIGEQLEVELKLPAMTNSVRVSGTVRWLRDLHFSRNDVSPGFGMQWSAIPEELALAIRKFVSQRETLYYEAA
jgi:uncharacterized protein (TIGR02266 family)